MIDVYTWPTTNGHKILIILEECGQRLGCDWQVHCVDIGTGQRFAADFLKISPNNKISALNDSNGSDAKAISVFEAGAMLLFLATKFGKLSRKSDSDKLNTLQWLMFQVGCLAPMLGQTHLFRMPAPEKIDCAIKRYTNESKRLNGVMDTQLGKTAYLASKNYNFAEIAAFPWARSVAIPGVDMAAFVHVKRWLDAIDACPAVKRGVAMLAERRKPPARMSDQQRLTLFGIKAPTAAAEVKS